MPLIPATICSTGSTTSSSRPGRYRPLVTMTTASSLNNTIRGLRASVRIASRTAGVKIAAAGARLVGVRVDDLESAHGAVQQFALGEDSDSVRALEQVIDRIGARFGEGAAQAGSLIRPRASTTTTRELS